MDAKHLTLAALALAVALPVSLVATTAAGADRSIVADPGLRKFLESFEEGTRRFMNGDTSLWMENLSRRGDVMIMGAWGAHEKGWSEVKARYDWAGARFRDSAAKLTVEYLTAFESGDLAFTTAVERAEVKVAGQEKAAPMALRVSHVFRKEDGAWKLVLRHADPLVAKTAPEAVLEKR
jgi:ketosteroid isomerase-like protein